MSAAHDNMDAVIEAVATRKIPMPVLAGSGIAILLGLGGFGYALGTGQANWGWGAFVVGLVFTLGLSMGGVMFAVILTMAKAHWGRPLKRIAEAFGLFLPFGWILLLVLLTLGLGLYPWHEGTFLTSGPVDLEPHSAFAIRTKPIWLSPGFFIARQALSTLLLFGLGLFYVYTSIKPDLIRAKAVLGDKSPGWWGMVAGSGTDWKASFAKAEKTMQIVGVPLGALYAMIFSLIAFDLLMSLSPWWYTNMFGAWFFMSSVWISMCMLGIYALLAKDWLGIHGFVTRTVTHDLGKLILAWCMFWAYTTFAQLLPIWYGQLPEETDYLLVRLFALTDTVPAGNVPWYYLASTVGVMCFVLPFTVLLSRGIKKMKWPFIALLCLILIGVFLERSLVVYPSVHLEQTFPIINLLIIGVPVWLGFIGAFILVVTAALSQLPALNVADPKTAPHPWDEHLHSLDAHTAHH